MKLSLPSTTILTMALYGTSAAAFSLSRNLSRRMMTAPAAAALASRYLSTPAVVVDARKNHSPSTRRPFGTSSTKLSMAEEGDNKPFTTWTFDNACASMEMNELASATFEITDNVDLIDDADLIVVGIQGPPAKEGEDEESKEESEDDGVPAITLVGKAKELDEAFGGALSEVLGENYKAFKNGSKAGATTPSLRLVTAGAKAKRVVLLGLGPEGKDMESDFLAKMGSTLASQCDSHKKISSCALVLPSTFAIAENIPLEDISAHFYSTLYSDNRYRTKSNVLTKAEDLKSVSIVTEGSLGDAEAANAALTTGKGISKGVSLAKDIVNAPHNILNSESLANVAKQIADESGGTITCTILGKEECEARGMGAYLGVARGSETQPQFIHLTYSPKSGNASKKVGIIGKGLLFDTGGYNIKTAMMELMKFDCGGSAAVLGAARAVGELAPDDVEAHFIVAACENMINDRAVVPSDILTASNGKTIEIVNTDAEGRLTLADALVYADKEVGCESIIELSTLTGACMVSLGKNVCGVWTDNDDLANELADVSEVTGDKSWRMPLVKEYNEQLKSKIADIGNCGTRYGGAITAALFLQHFVDKKKPFAHIDIAGPVWDDKSGATGFGAKMVTEWVRRQGKN